MPGIVGLISKMPRSWSEPQLRRMTAALRHESFYHSGTWIDEDTGVYVGWTTRAQPCSDQMPLQNASGTVRLVFSGEEFPDPELAGAIAAQEAQERKQASSYLLASYEQDPSFPARLNGRFHGLLVDHDRGRVLLFNDRFGMHRIYYHETKQAFYFAAEAKAILAVRPELRRLDVRSLGEYLATGCVLENRTLFQGIEALPTASAWSFCDGGIKRRGAYFRPEEWESQAIVDAETYGRELELVFARNLSRYFAGPEPIAVSLTGGLDTRMIMAWAKNPPASMPCYSFADMRRETEDVAVARRVAQACEQSYSVIPLGEEFLKQFAHYAQRCVYLTDGCSGVDRCGDLYLNQRAREIAPVRMTGNYGGEVLRRVRAFKPTQPSRDVFHPDLFACFRQAAQTYDSFAGVHPLTFSAFLQAPWHHYGLLALEETQVSIRTPYLDNDLLRTVYRAPASACSNDDVCLRLIAKGDRNLARIRTDRGVQQNGGITAALRRKLLEFTFKAEYAYDDGMPQWVAGVDSRLRAFALERWFLGRHKFAHYRTWYRDALAGYVGEMLLDSKTLSRPYLQRGGVETIVRHHLKGDRNYTSEIHQLLTLELIHRNFID